MIIEKYSFGIGDRFAHQGKAQLLAFLMAQKQGVNIIPVWNKSHREHTIVKTEPPPCRSRFCRQGIGWSGATTLTPTISVENVDLDSSDFSSRCRRLVGKPALPDVIKFVNKYKNRFSRDSESTKNLTYPKQIRWSLPNLLAVGSRCTYRHIEAAKGRILHHRSLDGRNRPVNAGGNVLIPAISPMKTVQTIARNSPAASIKYRLRRRRFKFATEFEQDHRYCFAIKGLPKVSNCVHSGSDKFSLYKHIQGGGPDTGLHLQTAGTTARSSSALLWPVATVSLSQRSLCQGCRDTMNFDYMRLLLT
jgi:hypothetical protein